MTEPRFLQIHTLTPHTSALLNRDDSGLAKRLPFGGETRTRISSQCLKRHWRTADDAHALNNIAGAPEAKRSRELVTRKVVKELKDTGRFPEEVLDALEPEFQKAVYGDKGTEKRNRQTLLLGDPEIAWLRSEAERLATDAGGDATAAGEAAKQWAKDYRPNIKAMREATALPGGLTAALFGRMVTSDTDANITAPVHVAHAFTVHKEESESDYFTAVDDLAGPDETGADTIQETELTSGLFYGYVVVDLPGLIRNLGGDAALAGRVLHHLIHLIAEVSPQAKLGSTAPYSRAAFMLLEAGDRQPRSLAEAFRKPSGANTAAAVDALATKLRAFDDVYATGEDRRFLSVEPDIGIPGGDRGALSDLATWAGSLPERLTEPAS